MRDLSRRPLPVLLDGHGRHRPAHPAPLRRRPPAARPRLGRRPSLRRHRRPRSAPSSRRASRTTSSTSSSPRAKGTPSTRTPRSSSPPGARKGSSSRDHEPAFYRYDQTFSPPGGDGARHHAPGLPRARAARAVLGQVVLPHERTLSGPKEDRLKLFRATRTNLSPASCSTETPQRALDAALDSGRVIAELSTPDGVHHALAKVTAVDALRAIVGRHRALAAPHRRRPSPLRDRPPLREETSAAHPKASQRSEHRFFMTFLANGDDPNLVVFPTHRHVHSLPSLLAATSSWRRAPDLRRAGARSRRAARRPSSQRCVTEAGGRASRRRRPTGAWRPLDPARRRRPRPPTRRSGERPGPPEDGRGRPSLGHPRAHPRHHARGPGSEDEPLVPAGRGAALADAPRGQGRCSS